MHIIIVFFGRVVNFLCVCLSDKIYFFGDPTIVFGPINEPQTSEVIRRRQHKKH